jgi:hypothetical protein
LFLVRNQVVTRFQAKEKRQTRNRYDHELTLSSIFLFSSAKENKQAIYCSGDFVLLVYGNSISFKKEAQPTQDLNYL